VLLVSKATAGRGSWKSAEYDYNGTSTARIQVKAPGADSVNCHIFVDNIRAISRPQRAHLLSSDKYATCQIPIRVPKR
jgi:hypothetical protein